MTTISNAPDPRNKGQNQYIITNRDAWIEQLLQIEARELRGPEKVVAISIAMHVDQTGRCRKSSALLAEACGMDEGSVRRRLEKLEAEGWIGVEHSGGRYPNSFFLRTPPDVVAPSFKGGNAHV
jgi:hypothetical protein